MRCKMFYGKGKRAVALGLFDGVHLGHRRVIGYPAELAEFGFVPSVFTFSNSTITEKQGRGLEYIYTDAQKGLIMGELGIKEIFSEDFNALKGMSGDEFVREILVRRLNTGYVVCGSDFKFGRNASCGVRELYALGQEYGFGVEIAEDVKADGENVSSKRIRELLKNGGAEAANRLLGDRYRIDGEAVHGRQLGRTIGFPTVNQPFGRGQLVPRHGVYRSEVDVDGIIYGSITDIGVKPTVGSGNSPLAETHIPGFSGDLYGRLLTVRISEFIREEKKFSSVEELKMQIADDIEYIRQC